MKIYISVDMEGLAGIVHFSQEKEEQARFRKAMHNQLQWVIEGIQKSEKNSEIEEITIADSHGSGMNLDYDFLSDLDDRIYLISGSPRVNYMMPLLDESYDAVFFVGYHGGVGALNANMDHTYALSIIHNFKINGKAMSETQINAAYASEFDVPVACIIGDSGLEKEVKEVMPWVHYVKTKESISRFSAKYYPKKSIRENTIKAIQDTLKEDFKAMPKLRFEKPYHVEIEFNFGSQLDLAMTMPNVEIVDGRTIAFTSNDYKELFNQIMMIVSVVRKGFPFN